VTLDIKEVLIQFLKVFLETIATLIDINPGWTSKK